MKWTNDTSGGNVEDRRGKGRGVIFGGGLGTLVIAAIVFFLGGNPTELLSSGAEQQSTSEVQRELSDGEKKIYQFVDMLTGANQTTWKQVFEENNLKFTPAKVVIFENDTYSNCGTAQSAMGPFYCPADHTIYMDMSFFQELEKRFGARVTEFTVAYVLGHEYGHHIQNLLGVLSETDKMRRSGKYTDIEMNKISIATELQADFYAGLWAKKTNDRTNFLEVGDIDAAISAAEAVGDDNIQKRTQGYVNQEGFTHGTSAQRKEWFMRGYHTGDIRAGITFQELVK